MGRRWASAYFDREYNAWAVGRHDLSRGGRAESFSTYPDQASAEAAARGENDEEERRDAARRTITHNETVQALNDAAEFRRRFPGRSYDYNWFVVQFNLAIDKAKSRGWQWEVYQAAVKAALDASKTAPKPAAKRARAARKT